MIDGSKTMVNIAALEVQSNQIKITPTVVGYLLNNQGKRIKCRVTTDAKGNIIFASVEPIEESDQ